MCSGERNRGHRNGVTWPEGRGAYGGVAGDNDKERGQNRPTGLPQSMYQAAETKMFSFEKLWNLRKNESPCHARNQVRAMVGFRQNGHSAGILVHALMYINSTPGLWMHSTGIDQARKLFPLFEVSHVLQACVRVWPHHVSVSFQPCTSYIFAFST